MAEKIDNSRKQKRVPPVEPRKPPGKPAPATPPPRYCAYAPAPNPKDA